MNKLYILVALIIVLCVAVLAKYYKKDDDINTHTPTTNETITRRPETRYQLLTAQEFKEKYENDSKGILIDVRTIEEFNLGHISAAKNIDIQKSTYEIELKRLDNTLPYYVYCKSGNRSQIAINAMKKLGFTELYEMRGGISVWQSLNYPITKSL